MIGTYCVMLDYSDYKKDIKNVVKLAKKDDKVSEEDFKDFIENRVRKVLEEKFKVVIDDDLEDTYEFIIKEKY